MFKSLRTSTKLLLLCIVFVGALLVATYGLVAEKQIAIDFVRKELVGVQHLEALRGVYATILKANPVAPPNVSEGNVTREALDRLRVTDLVDSGALDTAPLERALSEATDKLASAADDGGRRAAFVDALTAARNLASRIGDDLNLTLDPDLDSYYVQDVVVAKMPNSAHPDRRAAVSARDAFLCTVAAQDPSGAYFGAGRHDSIDHRRDREGSEGIIPRRWWCSASAIPRCRLGCHDLGMERLS